ncbi:MAG TPA: hypothetical protein VJ831_09190 [Jatrophihabitantaceae bacterium]|nr:hypothetical protein [Jatrophihabitantaceae bacterium]
MNARGRAAAITVAAGCGIALLAAPPAATAAQSTQELSCDGITVTIRSGDNNSSDHGGFGVAQIVAGGSGHLIPTSFAGSLYDVNLDETIFSFDQSKGGGHANHQQDTVSCTQEQDGVLADFLEPGDEPPAGASPTDDVVFTITATAVHQG